MSATTDIMARHPADPGGRERIGPRLLLYSHDGMGLGHTRRNLAIATAVRELAPAAVVLLVTGIDEVHRLSLTDNVSILKLPGLTKIANDQYEGRGMPIPIAEFWRLRSALLVTAVKKFRPAVLLADKHPFGAKGELRAAIHALRAAGGKVCLGLRDILDTPAHVVSEWNRYYLYGRISTHHDRVLVYGQQNVFDPVKEYDFPGPLAELTRYLGYVTVTRERDVSDDGVIPLLAGVPRDRPVVLASAGGGEDGFAMLHTFIRAAAGAPWHGIVLAGLLASDKDREALRKLATEAGVTFYTFLTQYTDWLDAVGALVCMGGYNSLVEAMAHATPTVCVPRVTPRSEQLLRATAFERLGLLNTVPPEQLNVERLREQVRAALAISRPQLRDRVRDVLCLDGARQTASQLLELAAMKPVQTEVVDARQVS